MFGRKKRQKREAEIAAIQAEISRPHKGNLLDACASDVERRSLCLQWAGQLRTEWYDGLQAQVEYVLTSKHPRYKQYPPAVRRKIGEQQWSASKAAKDLAATEQMYSRWAMQYNGGSQ